MNESKIHSLIRTELQSQYEDAKQKWLNSHRFDIDWTPDWDWLRCETAVEVGKEVDEWPSNEYPDAYEVVLDGMVFMVWESMIEGFRNDLRNTKDNLRYDAEIESTEKKMAWRKCGL